MQTIIPDYKDCNIAIKDAISELHLCDSSIVAYVGTEVSNEDEFNRVFILGCGIPPKWQDQAQFHTIGRPHLATFYYESKDCTESSEYKCISGAIEYGRNVMLFNDMAELTKYARTEKWRW